MDKTERAALYKKWIAQMINGATDERLLEIAYGVLDSLFSRTGVKRA